MLVCVLIGLGHLATLPDAPDEGEVLQGGDLLGLLDELVVLLELEADVLEERLPPDKLQDLPLGTAVDQEVELGG